MRVTEGETEIEIPTEKPTKKAPAFYNKAAIMQRNTCLALLQATGKKNLRAIELLAGTGVRSARILREIPKNIIKEIDVNDVNPKAVKYIKKNVKDNRATIHNKKADEILSQEKAYDYIDIDPFGSPNPFLDGACKRLRRGGILAVTATDTAALTGNAIRACIRKYFARPLYSEYKHEAGMRILMRKAQLIGAQYDVALEPIYCHSTRHYMRAYFVHSGSDVKNILSKHLYLHHCFRCLERKTSHSSVGETCCGAIMSVAGPLWTGKMWDEKIAQKAAKHSEKMDKETFKLATTIAEESKINTVSYYSIPKLASVLKTNPPRTEDLLVKLKDGARTHFGKASVRTTAELSTVKKAFLK